MPENCSVCLHGLLHLQSEGGCGDVAVGEPQLVQIGHRLPAGVGRQLANLYTILESPANDGENELNNRAKS